MALRAVRPSLFVSVLLGGLGASDAFAVRHEETRLNIQALDYSQTSTKESWETDAAGTTIKSSTDEKQWSLLSTSPALGFTAYANGIVLGGAVYGLPGLFGGEFFGGLEMTPGFELGLYTTIDYSSTVTKSKTDTGTGTSAEDATHDTSRDFGAGPYVRYATGPWTKSHLEVFFAALVHRKADDSETTSEHRKSVTIALSPSYVIPITRGLSYEAGLGLGYTTASSGSRETAGTTQKLTESKATTITLYPLTLRLLLEGSGGARAAPPPPAPAPKPKAEKPEEG